MKKTEQSFNSTLKMGNCELKRAALKAKSLKLAHDSREYAKVCEQLKTLAQGVSEYSNLKATCWPLECHHITGRENGRLLDVFNILVCKRSEHEEIHEHNTFAQKQKLLALVKEIRFKQGFKYTGEFTAELEAKT